MSALNFQKRFVPKIESGEKTHTIRAMRQRMFRVGEGLSLYYGQRTKACRLLMVRTCTAARVIQISAAGNVWIDGCLLSHDEREALAVRDGFASHSEMMTFWKGRLPFRGQIIHWKFEEAR